MFIHARLDLIHNSAHPPLGYSQNWTKSHPHCKDTIPKIRNRKGTTLPQSQFPHSCVCERFIYSHHRSAYSAAGKYVNRSWEYINRSHTHECGNRDWGRAIRFLGIHKWDFLFSVHWARSNPHWARSRPHWAISHPPLSCISSTTWLDLIHTWLDPFIPVNAPWTGMTLWLVLILLRRVKILEDAHPIFAVVIWPMRQLTSPLPLS
jgi:hypothetical protein